MLRENFAAGTATTWKRSLSSTSLTALAAGAAVGFTALVTVGLLNVEYRNSSAHLALETANASIAVLVSYLLYGRLRRRNDQRDLFMSQGLALLAAASLTSTALLMIGQSDLTGKLYVWLPLAARLVGATLLAAGAVSRASRRVNPRWSRWSLVLPACIFLVLAVLLRAVAGDLTVPTSSTASPPEAVGLSMPLHSMFSVAQIYLAFCFAVTSLACARAAGGTHDELMRWLAPACAFACFACLNFLLFPSILSEWLYTGDLLRTAFYLLLLVGAAREIRQYWVSHAAGAVMEDRRRLARELHDGVVQELGYIKSEVGPLSAVDGARRTRILGACDRALDEARQAIEVMGSSMPEPLGFALHRAVRQVAERYDIAVELDLDDTVTAASDQRHSLLRIVREAVSNAARHGKADRIHLELSKRGGERQLKISDDGTGFDVAEAGTRRAGFGLTSMRERAENLPGTFGLSSGTGQGTTVTVRW